MRCSLRLSWASSARRSSDAREDNEEHLSTSDTRSLRDVLVDGDRDRDAYGDARREEINSLSADYTLQAGYVDGGSEERDDKDEVEGKDVGQLT